MEGHHLHTFAKHLVSKPFAFIWVILRELTVNSNIQEKPKSFVVLLVYCKQNLVSRLLFSFVLFWFHFIDYRK